MYIYFEHGGIMCDIMKDISTVKRVDGAHTCIFFYCITYTLQFGWMSIYNVKEFQFS